MPAGKRPLYKDVLRLTFDFQERKHKISEKNTRKSTYFFKGKLSAKDYKQELMKVLEEHKIIDKKIKEILQNSKLDYDMKMMLIYEYLSDERFKDSLEKMKAFLYDVLNKLVSIFRSSKDFVEEEAKEQKLEGKEKEEFEVDVNYSYLSVLQVLINIYDNCLKQIKEVKKIGKSVATAF